MSSYDKTKGKDEYGETRFYYSISPNFRSRDGYIAMLIGPAAFSSPGELATTLGHENVHAEQMVKNTVYANSEGNAMNEIEAYAWELANAQENGLTPAEIADIRRTYYSYYNELPADAQARAAMGDFTSLSYPTVFPPYHIIQP